MNTIQLDETPYSRLAEALKLQKEIDAQVTALKAEMLAYLQERGATKVTTEYGSFTVATRTSYTYTEAVKKLEEKTKLAKVKEEQKGLAQARETHYIVYKEAK
jgi:hypothetical protein